MNPTTLATLAAVALGALPAAAGTYVVDPTHSEVSFQVRHFFTPVRGRFTEFEGQVSLDPERLEESSVSFTIDAASIDTGLGERDEHLRAEDFFWVENHPEILFESRTVTPTEPNQFEVRGTLSIRGVDREVALPVEYLGELDDPWGGRRASFSTAIELDRKDYGLIWNVALDNGGVVLSDKVKITIHLETLLEKES